MRGVATFEYESVGTVVKIREHLEMSRRQDAVTDTTPTCTGTRTPVKNVPQTTQLRTRPHQSVNEHSGKHHILYHV